MPLLEPTENLQALVPVRAMHRCTNTVIWDVFLQEMFFFAGERGVLSEGCT